MTDDSATLSRYVTDIQKIHLQHDALHHESTGATRRFHLRRFGQLCA